MFFETDFVSKFASAINQFFCIKCFKVPFFSEYVYEFSFLYYFIVHVSLISIYK